MTTSTMTTDPLLWRQTVALVAEHAKAKLPAASNGRVDGAVKLVLAHDVTRLDDGTIEVGSSSDPLKTYRLEGTTCTCKDFTDGRAPEGWCKHRISAGIDKRVRELLPLSPAPEPEPQAPVAKAVEQAPLYEAPASVNVRLTVGGREVQWTLRDSDEARLAVRLEALLQRYPLPPAVSPQPQPQPEPLTPQQHNAAAMHRPVDFCPVHNVAMKLNEKDGRQWRSHWSDDEQRWCKGR